MTDNKTICEMLLTRLHDQMHRLDSALVAKEKANLEHSEAVTSVGHLQNALKFGLTRSAALDAIVELRVKNTKPDGKPCPHWTEMWIFAGGK